MDAASIEKQAARDAEYEQACQKWLETASAAEIARAKSLGLVRVVKAKGKPERIVFAETGRQPAEDVCQDDDASALFGNSTALSEQADMATATDKPADLLREHYGLTAEQAGEVALYIERRVKAEVHRETSSVLHRIIGFFLMPGEDLRIRAHGLAHAARMASAAGFTSLRKSAERIGCSVEAVRKVAWRWVELLNLPPLEGAKTAEARAAYAEDKRTNHWRTRICQKTT